MASLTNLLPDLTSISLALLGIKRLQKQTSQTTISCFAVVEKLLLLPSPWHKDV